MTALPPDAERLLAVPPDRFVDERKALAKRLRGEGRPDEAKVVEGLKKPSAVVLAVNRAARDRPKAAENAAAAAERVRDAQVGGDAERFREGLADLDSAVDLLADVAVAQLSPPGKSASEAMRRRARDLLRAAVADDDARPALARGVLTEELDAPGFSPFAAMPVPKKSARKKEPSAAERRKAEREAQLKELREELRQAESELDAATKAARAAEKKVASLRKKLERG